MDKKIMRRYTTTRYLESRDNPANPTNHESRSGEYYDYRLLVELASREEIEQRSPGEGYQLDERKDKETGQIVRQFAGRSSRVLSDLEEQWLISKGYVDENGHVIQEKLKELKKRDEEIKQQKLESERSRRQAAKAKATA